MRPMFTLISNKPLSPEQYEGLVQIVSEFAAENDMYVDDCVELDP